MLSSKPPYALAGLAALLLGTLWSPSAHAQQAAQGFDLERLYTSAPGGGWIVMDALDMHGHFGGAASFLVSYARNPLRVTDGTRTLAVVSDEAFMQFGLAGTYDRFRLYLTLDSPLTVQGNSGTIGGYTFTGPSVDQSSSPDAISHGRAGFDARLLGGPTDPFRLGLGLQLYFPGGAPGAIQSYYLSDGPPTGSVGAYNFQARILFAGDVGPLVYAGQLGFHLRQLDESPTPGAPQGNEMLFGAAAGAKFLACGACSMRLVVGPEVFGETAIKSFFGASGTGVEGLLSARLEGFGTDGPQLRFKLGVGGGLDARFGAPEARAVLGIEVVGHASNGE